MADAKNIHQRLLAVQSNLVAPRQAGGRFGKARSAEQILEALKPLLKEHGLLLTTTENVQQKGDSRFYMVCTATVINVDEPDQRLSVTAEAREGEEERGLDPSQVTGKASSYAKKYALQHLFSIDDTKDADHSPAPEPAAAKKTPAEPVKAAEPSEAVLKRAKAKINEVLEQQGYTTSPAKKAFIVKVLGHSTIDDLNEADLVMDQLENEGGTQ